MTNASPRSTTTCSSPRLLEELAETSDIEGTPREVRVNRWMRSFPQYEPGHLDLVERIERELAEEAPNILVTGAAFRGLGRAGVHPPRQGGGGRVDRARRRVMSAFHALRLFAARGRGAGLLLAASLPPWGWWPLAFVGLGDARSPHRRPTGLVPVPPGVVGGGGAAVPDAELARHVHGARLRDRRRVLLSRVRAGVHGVPAERSGPVDRAARARGCWRKHSEVAGRSAASRCPGWRWDRSTARSSTSFASAGRCCSTSPSWRSASRSLPRFARTGGSRWSPVCARRRRHRVGRAGADRPRHRVAAASRSCRAADRRARDSSRPTRPIVFQRHVDATDAVHQPVDMVLWPEDVVNIEGPSPTARKARCLSEHRSPAAHEPASSAWSKATATASTTRRWPSIPKATSSIATRRCGECRSASTCRSADCSSPSPAAR